MKEDVTNIRKLASDIDDLGKDHAAWPMCREIVYNSTSYLRAIATMLEYRNQIEELRSEIGQMRLDLENMKNKPVMKRLKEVFFKDLLTGDK